MPTAVVPVASHVHGVVGNHNKMEGLRRDRPLAPRTRVFLACLIGLDGGDGYVENSAHAMRASAVPTANTTMTMSRTEMSWGRNGLNPMSETVTGRLGCLPSLK